MRTNGYGKPIVAFDIDGTLADYHEHFLRFAEGYFGRAMPSATEINRGFKFHRFMGVSLRDYRDCKLAYRQGGLKRNIPFIPGAAELVEHVRQSRAEVWICTTRPYLRLDNIDPDTREALRRNGIKYDALLFDPTEGSGGKYRELKRQAGTRVAAVVEDLPIETARALRLGLVPIYLRNRPYNRPLNTIGADYDAYPDVDTYGVERWDTAGQLAAMLEIAIEGWKRS